MNVSDTLKELDCIYREESFFPWMRDAAFDAICHIRKLEAELAEANSELEAYRTKAKNDAAVDEALGLDFAELRAKLEATQAELEETKAALAKANDASASLYDDGVNVSAQNDGLRRKTAALQAKLADANHQFILLESYAENLERSLSDARAQRDRFESDLEQLRESFDELQQTTVPVEEHRKLRAKLEESHDTIRLLAGVLRDTLKGER